MLGKKRKRIGGGTPRGWEAGRGGREKGGREGGSEEGREEGGREGVGGRERVGD